LAPGMTMPFMICLMLATGVAIGASTAAAVRVVRAPAMMNPIPLTNSATLTTKSQDTVRTVVHCRTDARYRCVKNRNAFVAILPTMICVRSIDVICFSVI
jgi:hypothetical protein